MLFYHYFFSTGCGPYLNCPAFGLQQGTALQVKRQCNRFRRQVCHSQRQHQRHWLQQPCSEVSVLELFLLN